MARQQAPSSDGIERLPIFRQVQQVLEECRIVLPGLQVLFGFQLAVVFSERFAHTLLHRQQILHLLSMTLVAIAIAVIMTPAAYHRQAEPHEVSAGFVRLATLLLLASMPLLAIAICLEIYLVAQVLLPGAAIWIACTLLAVFVLLWLMLPRVVRGSRQRTDDR